MKPRILRSSALVAALACALALAGCTGAGQDASNDSAQSASPNSSVEATPTPSPSSTIEPVIVVAGVDVDGKNVSVSGYVSGTIQSQGECTFTFTHETASPVTVTHEVTADRDSTSCGTSQVPIASFTRGTWKVTLAFDVEGKQYTSQTNTLEVP
ncbi:hypothetical protein [Leifsonia sp. NPDC058230]|uniref:hypothetical protein n=1 Tax=Leifsonia sp. NPDC058230 TaxID=3346391 RepID=UPI0036D7FD4A